jgi:hypothetical protein
MLEVNVQVGVMGGRTCKSLRNTEQNAAECRQKASQTTDPQLKKQLEEMAEVWDRLAREGRQGIVENTPDKVQPDR